jgi:hypothetical protein
MMQMVACGEMSSLDEGRAMIRASFETKRFEPEDGGEWESAFELFTKLLAS